MGQGEQQKSLNVPFPVGEWSFENDDVVDNFPFIADANIPNYRAVIQKCVAVAEQFLSKDALIVDVGCARGATLEALYNHGFTNLVGVDGSAKMLKKCFSRAKLLHSNIFPADLKQVDFILANWVLHFVRERQQYLEDIYRALRAGGTFVLTEKIAANSELKTLYHDFKRKSGMTEMEIRDKERGIRGVLIPFSLEWYLGCLNQIGFKDVSIIDAHFSFVTFYAKK
jgi:SAM-dependent methyltransferase